MNDMITIDRTKLILYLAASPRTLPPVRSDLEVRKVQERLRLSKHRDRYCVEPVVAARFEDLTQALFDQSPQVVHLSGHGDRNGDLYVEDDLGNHEPIAVAGLAELFSLQPSIECVIVNACYSTRLAEELAVHVEHVIGMDKAIGDEAAIQFSVGFYQALFAGRSVPEAFVAGRAGIRSRTRMAPEHATPQLFCRDRSVPPRKFSGKSGE